MNDFQFVLKAIDESVNTELWNIQNIA